MDVVVSVSKALKQMKRLQLLGIHPVTINNGLPELNFAGKEFEKIFPQITVQNVESFKILSIGRLSPEKGYQNLIKAVADLSEKNIEVCLVIAGDGPEK